MSDGLFVTLEPWEYEHGFQVGIRRFTANWCRGDAPHYRRELMEEDRKAQAAAALCELAVAKYLNQYWHGSIWHVADQDKYRRMPDVGVDIEVRRVRTQAGVTVRRMDAGRTVWGARCADPEYRKIELLGYVSADKALKLCRGQYVLIPFENLTKPWKTASQESTESGEKSASKTVHAGELTPSVSSGK